MPGRLLKVAGSVGFICVIAGAAIAVTKGNHKEAAVRGKMQGLRQAFTSKPVALTESPDPDRKSTCEVALRSANQNSAVLKNWKQYGKYVNVRVHGGFYRTDFEHKQALDQMVRCVVSDGRADDQGLKHVTYRDAKTDELVAEWSKATGFRMSE